MNDSHPRSQDHPTADPAFPQPADGSLDASPEAAAAPGPPTEPEAVDTSTSGAPMGGPDHPSDVDAAEGDGPEIDLAGLADADPRTRPELFGALVTAEAQRDEYLDDLRRARAEFENYRRRVMRDGATQRDTGKGEVVTALLEVLDDLDRTMEASEDSEDPSLAKGVQLVASKLTSALGSHGLTRIDAVDEPFDPSEHEAVQQQPSDEPLETPIVTQVLRPGYRLGDRVLRPAMVVVAS